MRVKKAFLLFLVLSATYAYPGSKAVAPPAPPPSEEVHQPVATPEPPLTPTVPVPHPEVPAPLPSSHEMTDSYESAFVRMLVTLLGLIVLVFVTFWILRRLGKGKFKVGSGRSVNVIERRALSPKTMLYLVEFGDKKVLLSESQLEVRALATYEEPPPDLKD